MNFYSPCYRVMSSSDLSNTAFSAMQAADPSSISNGCHYGVCILQVHAHNLEPFHSITVENAELLSQGSILPGLVCVPGPCSDLEPCQ